MTITQRGILALLKSALTGQPQALPEGFDLTEADALVRKHNILPMIYQGAYLCGIPQELPLMQTYRTQYFRRLIRSEQQMRAVERIFRAFEENGIDYMPVKGCTVKALYPQPELRPMGDADILIRMEQYDRIRGIMEALGYREGEATSYHIEWFGPHLMVELHNRFFDAMHGDLCSYFGDGWPRAVHRGGSRYGLSLEDDFAYVFFHMAKHFRASGIGIRHMLDIYVYRRSHPELSEPRVEAIMKSVGLLTFYHNILELLEYWFGEAPGDPVLSYMSGYVFASGNFGSYENFKVSQELRMVSRKRGGRDIRGYSLFRAVVPTVEQLGAKYPALEKSPWLYPVYWLVRLWDVLRRRPGAIRYRLRAIRKIDASHREMMEAIGLDYGYESKTGGQTPQ